MEQALHNVDTIESIHDLLTLYNSSASNLLNTHAPLKTKKLRITHNQPWFSDKIRQEIIVCRHEEKTWREVMTEYNLNAFYNQWHFVSYIIKLQKETTTSGPYGIIDQTIRKSSLLPINYCTEMIHYCYPQMLMKSNWQIISTTSLCLK